MFIDTHAHLFFENFKEIAIKLAIEKGHIDYANYLKERYNF